MAVRESKLVISLVDRLTGPAKSAGAALDDFGTSVAKSGKSASKEMEALGNALREAKAQAAKLDVFKALQKDMIDARQAFRTAQTEVGRLAQELDKAKKVAASYDGIKAFSKSGPIAREMTEARRAVVELERQLRAARSTVSNASEAFTRHGRAVIDAKRALADMGINLKSVGGAESALKAKIDQTTEAIKRQAGAEEAAATAAERLAQRRERLMRVYQGATAVAAGTMTAAHMLARPTSKAMTYDQQLTYAALTMAGGGTQEEKRAAKVESSAGVDNAVVVGGGTREGALTAFTTLVGSGTLTKEQVLGALPSAAKTAFAAGASPEDAAKTAVAMLNNGVKTEELQAGFDAMVRAGELGGVEFKDMARWLPQQLALGRGAGLTGLEGVRKLAGYNQVALSTAASPDQAANNVVNLLQKLNSRELQETMEKNVTAVRGDPVTKKIKGKGKKRKTEVAFNWQEYMLQQMKFGVNPLEAFAGIMDRELSQDKEYGSIKNQIASAKTPDEQRALLEKATGIAEASKFGKLIADRDALMAALALYYGRGKLVDLGEGIENSGGTVDANSQFVREQTWSKAQDVKNTADRANEEAYQAIEGPLGALTDKLNEAARAFPEFTAGLYAAGTLLGAVAGAGIAGSVAGGIAGRFTSGGAAAATAAGAGGTAAGVASSVPRFAATTGPLAFANLGNATTAEDGAILDRAVEAHGTVRQLVGDDVLKAARDKYQPWYRWSTIKSEDGNDPKYVRKHLLDQVKETTAGWPDAATDGITRYTEAIAQGGATATAQADAIGNEIREALSVTGAPDVDTSRIERALGLARQLGETIRIGAAGSPAAASPPAPLIDGARASGGPVRAGGTYVVGEEGPELFTPGRSGAISPFGLYRRVAAARSALAWRGAAGESRSRSAAGDAADIGPFDLYRRVAAARPAVAWQDGADEDESRALPASSPAAGAVAAPPARAPVNLNVSMQVTVQGETDLPRIARQLGRMLRDEMQGVQGDLNYAVGV